MEGDHHLEGAIMASPWSDEQRLDDESLTQLAVADRLRWRVVEAG